ncbi:ABC transporter ATP-binding protein [Streptomyces sp. NPDC005529]|uniref:ABC transporter ATP-binding protein n=1 Tax=unclassified Streptomyces TaxID=2593676 RepID=UPI0033A6E282
MAVVMLEVEGLDVNFGAVRALDQVHLVVERGKFCVVLGANGAGKSTLLRAVSGLVKPSAGTVSVAGRQIQGMPVEEIAGGGVAHILEGDSAIVQMTVEENLRLGGLRAGPRAARRHRVDEMFGLFPALAPHRHHSSVVLSGGERRMLAIGRGLMGEPRLVLLDEPSLGLSPGTAEHLLRVLRRLCDQTGLTVVLSEQNARSALSVADQAVVFDLGRIVIDGDAAQVASDGGMMTRLRRAYLGF